MRPAGPEDRQFIYEVYVSTRAEEVAAWGWPEEQQALFLKMQFNLRESAYRSAYSNLDDNLILLEGSPVGRFMWNRGESVITMIDLGLLHEYRNRGIGTHVIRVLFAEADSKGLPVRLHVLRSNTGAGRLYERL